MFAVFRCTFFSWLLLGVGVCGNVVYPRLLEARGLDAEKILYIQDDVVLRLQKTSVLSESFVFSENINGRRVDKIMNGKELEADMYYDRNRMASVNLKDKNGGVEVKGILSHRLRIAPLDISARTGDGPIPHKIFEVEQRAVNDVGQPVGPKKESNNKTFYAELRIVADEYHRGAFKSDEELVQYFALCIKLVNIRYEDTSDPRVQFLLTTVEVAENNFTEVFYAPDVDCPGRSVKIYMDPVLMINKTAKIYGNSNEDITVFVTSVDLADHFDGSAYNHVMGQAKLGGLCSRGRRVAIVEDAPPTYSLIQIIAHELAHTLGVSHDGEKPLESIANKLKSNCSGRSGHLMSPSAHGKNNGHFSDCSIEQMKAFVSTLNKSCLEVKLQTYHEATTHELPGKNLNRTYYCKTKHPNYPRISSIDENYYKPLCKVLCCADGIYPCFEEPAVDGMPCDHENKKICFRHQCVLSQNKTRP
uniref:Putative secreted metalloprotease n=1 Tax=Ixodes ricinus TaxID=34613 RepID=A0A6B0VEH1_IXORI